MIWIRPETPFHVSTSILVQTHDGISATRFGISAEILGSLAEQGTSIFALYIFGSVQHLPTFDLSPMHRPSFFLLAAIAFIAADGANMTPEQIKDYDRLTGTFVLVSGIVDGKPVAEDVRKKTILVTDHNKFTLSTGDEAGTSARGTFTIDPTKTPKTVDSLQETGPDKGKTILGIYEIVDENHKRECWSAVGKPRPTKFSSEPGSAHILQVWERKRP